MLQYSAHLNFTLTLTTLRASYLHQDRVTARVFNACECPPPRVDPCPPRWTCPPGKGCSPVPPEISAQCLDRGVVFSVVGSSQTRSLWEVGVDQEPLTDQMAVQRGYRLTVHSHKTVLEIPLFSMGFTYEVSPVCLG